MCNVILSMEQYIALNYGIKIKKGQKARGSGRDMTQCSAPELWTATLAGPETCTLQMWDINIKCGILLLQIKCHCALHNGILRCHSQDPVWAKSKNLVFYVILCFVDC